MILFLALSEPSIKLMVPQARKLHLQLKILSLQMHAACPEYAGSTYTGAATAIPETSTINKITKWYGVSLHVSLILPHPEAD
jgi:hypothetical protein